jgi:DtxR family transcriptional regulator, Mn-dependent transcriptional regulator
VSDLIDTIEMYLRTIFELEEEGIVPLRARIAERLGHSGPTVSQTVARMERDGLLHLAGDRHLELTDTGRTKATRVMRKHRLAERLLLDVIGLEWEFVHDEACRWEHVMSDRVERKLLAMLQPPDEGAAGSGPLESPYGNPIPGLEELGGRASAAAEFRVGVVSLPEAYAGRPPATAGDGPVRYVIRRLGEPLQTDVALLGRLARAGVRPGSTVTVTSAGDSLTVDVGGVLVDLTPEVAAHVFVTIP